MMPSRSLALPLIVGVLIVVMQHTDPLPRELGYLRDGRYHHIATGVEFPLPEGWSVQSASGSSDDGEQVFLVDGEAPASYVAIWLRRERNRPAVLDAMLRDAPSRKREQRDTTRAQHYTFRPASIQEASIGGRKAVNATADFLAYNGAKQVEYFTWVFTERTRVQFDVRGVEPDARQTEARFQTIVRAARIP
jgi:hypothetical protein